MMSARSSTPTASGSPHQTPSATKTATSAGASAVPRPSKALSASTATSTRRGNSEAASTLIAGTVRPKPIPMHAVAPSSSANAAACDPMTNRLATSSAIDDRFAARPTRRTRFCPQRAPSRAPSSAAATAMMVWGANIAPYSPVDSP